MLFSGDQSEDDVENYKALNIELLQYPMTESEYPVKERVPNETIVMWWRQVHEIIVKSLQHKVSEGDEVKQSTSSKAKSILIHCVEGVNRSVSTCIYHLMNLSHSPLPTSSIKYPMSYHEASEFMKHKRSQMDLDLEFVELLKQQEQLLKPQYLLQL